MEREDRENGKGKIGRMGKGRQEEWEREERENGKRKIGRIGKGR